MIDKNYIDYVESLDLQQLEEMLKRINKDKFRDEYDLVKSTIYKLNGVVLEEPADGQKDALTNDSHETDDNKNFWERDSVAQQQTSQNDSFYGSSGRRIGAYILDSLLLGVTALLITRPFIRDLWKGVESGFLDLAVLSNFLMISLLLNIAGELYHILTTKFYGRSVGKRVMDIKIVDKNSMELLSLFGAVKRRGVFVISIFMGYLVNYTKFFLDHHSEMIPFQIDTIASFQAPIGLEALSSILSFVSFISFVLILARDDKRGIHDFIGQSIVIYER